MTPNKPLERRKLPFNTSSNGEVYKAMSDDSYLIEDDDIYNINTIDESGIAVEESSNNCVTEDKFDTNLEIPIEVLIETNNPPLINQYEKIKNDTLNSNHSIGLLGVTPSTVVNRNPVKKKQISDSIKQGEEEMAEVDTAMLSGQHADIRREGAEHASEIRYDIATKAGDIRREGAEHTNEIVKEGIKTGFDIRGDVKDARFDIGERIGNQGDRIVDRVEEGKDALLARTWDLGRDTQDLRAQVISQQQQMVAGFLGVSKDTELASLKGIIEGQKNTTYLADKISAEGDRTRALINDLKYHDLNRSLVERNSELVEERNWGRHWYHGANQAQFGQQFAQLQSQMQNFNSQLSETRQGMVNFGTMAGVGQTSSANNVR